MNRRLPRLGKAALSYLPSHSPRGIARRLILRANAARDARQWQVASALYEEALHLTPTGLLHKQCGHMFKEAGQLDAAEIQYREAERLNPNDADLAFQIGHFEKLRGDLSAADAAYRRALAIKPGWDEPQQELGRLASHISDQMQTIDDAEIIAELLPSDTAGMVTHRESVQIRRLGRITQTPRGARRVLRGVEAIRGSCTASQPLTEIVVRYRGEEIARRRLTGRLLGDGNTKYSFNIWLDFSDFRRGAGTIRLTFLGPQGRWRVHSADLEIGDPAREEDFPDSDSVVNSPSTAGADLAAIVNARPSIVRSSARAPVKHPVDAIFVQRIDQLGDLIVSVPALHRLRALFPSSSITLIISSANADFARAIDGIDEVIVVDVIAQADGRRAITQDAQKKLHTSLANKRFDLAIDLSQGAESRPLLRAARARFTYGFPAATAPWLSATFDIGAPDPVNGLETCAPSRKLLAMIDAIGRLHQILPVQLLPRPTADEPVSGDRPYLVLHAGARLGMNRWPFFPQLVDLLIERTAFDVVLMGLDIAMPQLWGDRVRVSNNLLPYPDFDALIGGCTVFVGNDSGPKHLAAVRGVPAVSLHLARLNWSEWGQEGRGSVISRRVPCAGCGIERDADECGMDFACLGHIRPAEVLAEILRLRNSLS